jgi:predicted amino acid-binding ACT domain protein
LFFPLQSITASHALNPSQRDGIKFHPVELSQSDFGESDEASSAPYTTIELTGRDRPGLISEISALLAQMRCNIVAAELWTHNMRVACLLYVTDDEEATKGPIKDREKLYRIKESLSNVLKGDKNSKGAKTGFACGAMTHTDRRLHQMMFADRDYERNDDGDGRVGGDEDDAEGKCGSWDLNGKISVEDCDEKSYSVVHIECRNRPKLVFDTLCTLTDMQYVVFHATIDTDGQKANQVGVLRLDFCMCCFLSLAAACMCT